MEVTAAKLNIDVARANFYPSLEIKAVYGYEAFRSIVVMASPESLAVLLAGEVAVPIFNRSAIIAIHKNADAKRVLIAYEYEQFVINTYLEVTNKIYNIHNLEKQYHLKNDQVNSLMESIELVNQLFASARAEFLKILLTQREALEAKMGLIELKQKQILALVELYRILGGGWQ
ncbi:MAG: TolC family protein [Gammaproteobacteria bacterium]|nr:TolC family protein [Gammaproteobacteria bacterium]